jgi:hypothetical protein
MLVRVFIHDVALDDERRQRLTELRNAVRGESVVAFLEKALARPNGEPAWRARRTRTK